MPHIHHTNALALLRSQPFTPEEFALIEAAAENLPWEQLSPMIQDLQKPATAEAARIAAYEIIAAQDKATNGIAGVCVLASAMFESAERFRSWGIDEKIVQDTMCVLHRFCGEYRQEFGTFGFDRGFWAWRQTCGQIFRLGALEYEYTTMTIAHAEHTGIAPATPVLSVHIPSSADLSREALDDSYARARAFYRAHPEVCLKEGLPPEAITCGSWLLCPKLRAMLKETSGIRRFAEDFELLHVQETSASVYHFLFWATEETPKVELADDTSLRRAVKAHLMAGGTIGSGYGLLNR